MSMKTSRLVFFAMSCLSFSISAPLRPMMMPGRDVRMVTRSLLPGRSTSIELTPALFHFAPAHAVPLQPLGQRRLQLQIFPQQRGIGLLGEPARPPGLIEAQPESVRMNFLSHLCFFLRHFNVDM